MTIGTTPTFILHLPESIDLLQATKITASVKQGSVKVVKSGAEEIVVKDN